MNESMYYTYRFKSRITLYLTIAHKTIFWLRSLTMRIKSPYKVIENVNKQLFSQTFGFVSYHGIIHETMENFLRYFCIKVAEDKWQN